MIVSNNQGVSSPSLNPPSLKFYVLDSFRKNEREVLKKLF